MELWLTPGERPQTMDSALNKTIDVLRGLTVAALKAKHLELFGQEAKSSNMQFLFRRIAWRLQANSAGGLSDRARRRAAEIADDADLRLRPPKAFLSSPAPKPWNVGRSRPDRDWRVPAPGTLITRRFENREIVVKVLEEGFEYERKHYGSLSAIAREVTGTRWNGLLFFGLADRRNG
jgi:hypothetical protein